MAITIDELLVGLGYDYDPEGLKKFQTDVKSTVDIVKKLALAAAAAATAITGMVIASTAASDEQGKLAGEIGETVENIDALQFALTRAGGTADSMANSLRSLASKASEAARGMGAGVEVFGILGLSSTDANGNLKTTGVLMTELSAKFQGLSKLQQIEFSEKLGIRDSLLLLQQGPEGIRELVNEAKALGVTTKEDAFIAAAFQDNLVDLWRIVKQFSRLITKDLAPKMSEQIKLFTSWWKINREIIQQRLPDIIDKISRAIKLLTIATGVWLSFKLVRHIILLSSTMKALNIQLLATNFLAAALPALIFASVVAIALLAQDANKFFEGGQSVIGDMIAKFPEFRDEILTTASVFATIWDVTMMIFEGWKQIFDLFTSGTFFSDLNVVINQLMIDFNSLFDNLVSSIKTKFSELWNTITDNFKADFINPIKESIDILLNSFKEKFSNPLKTITGGLGNVLGGIKDSIKGISLNPFNQENNQFQNVVPGLLSVPQVPVSHSNTSNSSRVNNIAKIEIIVSGAGDPEAVAKAVSNVFQQTAQDLNTAVVQ